QAEDGIRDLIVTGVQTCALPISLGAGSAGPTESDETWLAESRATFVTLMQGEELRGCVGTLEARRPLAEDVAANARAAAFEDSRSEERRVGNECRGEGRAEQ